MALKAQKPSPTTSATVEGETETDSAPARVPSIRFEPEKDLHSWKAPSRPFKKRGREFWVTVLSIAALLAFVLFLAEGVMPVILIISLVFLFYVLSTVTPEEIEYKITNRGVKVADKTTNWDFLTRYWFEKKLGSDVLVFESLNFPGRLETVALEKDVPKIKEVLKKYVPEEKPEQTTFDKASDWVSNKLSAK